MNLGRFLFPSILFILFIPVHSLAADLDEFKVKREAVFDFAQKPVVTRQGDRITIAFETKGFCDATVAVEDANGNIVRHLACGVLGPNAPEPLQKNAKRQSIVWDGKNDQGVYLDAKDQLTVRVSLGLKPQFERTLFWSPKKRSGFNYPAVCAAEEGVYVAEGSGVDHIRLFDHQGNYLRTVYPFPANKIGEVQGLKTHTLPGDDRPVPLKRGYLQATFLTSGTGGAQDNTYGESSSVNTMAAASGRLAVLHFRLNRLAADGTSGGLPLEGPRVGIFASRNEIGYHIRDNDVVRLPNRSDIGAYLRPRSAALSPNAKWLYLAGYHYNPSGLGVRPEWMNAVLRMPFEGDAEPTLFAGDLKPGIKNGSAENGKFRMVTSVACDAQGRVYVGDYLNDRVQVFDADGKFLKSVPVPKPAQVAIHQKTGDIYVFSWMLFNWSFKEEAERVERVMTHLGPLENPIVKAKCPLPMEGCTDNASGWNYAGGLQQRLDLDSWSDPPTVWVVNGRSGGIEHNDDGSVRGVSGDWNNTGVNIFEEVDGKLKPKARFAADVVKSIGRSQPPILWRQRLYVNPATGRLYVAEGDCGVMKAFNQLVEITPETGKIALVDLPLGSEDLCFGPDGLAYLRTDTIVARYDPKTWKEVPWDYGEERENHSYGMGARGAALTAGLITPGHRSFNFWHLGGVDVALNGRLVVTTCNGSGMNDAPRWGRGEAHYDYKSTYTPTAYPGRMRWGEIHIYDEHGRVLIQDAVPGMGHLNGIGIDRDDNLYMLMASRRLIDGKQYDPTLPRDASGTIVKVPTKKVKVLSSGQAAVPLAPEDRPKRPPEVVGYTSGWVEGARWFYGGVGFSTPGGCVCWNSRFDLDYFNRSFAPEPQRCSVAILDGSGNLILRIGKYGNVDDGVPMSGQGSAVQGSGQREPDAPSSGVPASLTLSTEAGPANPRSVGGDEVALAYACYVAAHTDYRLFIADAGNARILSVKLGYHANEKVALKDVQETAATAQPPSP